MNDRKQKTVRGIKVILLFNYNLMLILQDTDQHLLFLTSLAPSPFPFLPTMPCMSLLSLAPISPFPMIEWISLGLLPLRKSTEGM